MMRVRKESVTIKRPRILVLPLTLGLLFTVAIGWIASQAAPQAVPQSLNSGQHFIPPYGNARDRFGFDASGSLSGYDVAQLHAGWYSDWGASLDPAHPDQLVYVQLIRFHAGADRHDPGQVTVRPSKATIAQIAAAHPGSLWLMSNEPDSFYQGDPILPEVYAIVYHDFYEYIKGLDPTALIANGGIVQPTPCRLAYLDIVWDTFLETYGTPLPVDVWNIHAFILREVYNSWGASTPPGVDPSCAMNYTVEEGDDIGIFWDNIKAMRAWMKERGYQDRPLIISEYGVLWPTYFAPQFTPQRVSRFMTRTFDLFLHEVDPEIGYPADDYRLVQAWAWYSLADDQQYNGYLFYSGSKAISPMGEAYASYTGALSDTRHVDLNARLVAAWPSFTSTTTATHTGTAGLLTFTVSSTGTIGNRGKLAAPDVLARFEVLSGESGTVVWGHDAWVTVPARCEGLVTLPALTATLAAPGRHELRLALDPENQIHEPREWNNVATVTLDLRPDLLPVDLFYRLLPPQAGSLGLTDTLVLTSSVRNQGDWPSQAVSATAYLETAFEGARVASGSLPVPPLAVDTQVDLTTRLTGSLFDHDLYRVRVVVDEEARVPEQDEANNHQAWSVPITVKATLVPTATTVLTSATGAVVLVFPAGVVVTPTEVVYTPDLPAASPKSLINLADVAFSLTASRAGQPVDLALTRPFSVTWRYSDADVDGLDEEQLRLFSQGAGAGWHHAACQTYDRDPDQNQLTAVVLRLGRFVFGNRYDFFMPLALQQRTTQSRGEERLLAPESNLSGLPLRLPRR